MVIVLLLVGIWFVVLTKGHPKEPATIEQVSVILKNNHLVYADLTSDYQAKWEIDDNILKSAIASEDGDLRFDFFVFENEDSAESFRKKYQSFIRENRYANPNVEISEGAANYILYSIKAEGMYTINMRVANTLVFAYCDEKNSNKLNKVMTDLGYFNE